MSSFNYSSDDQNENISSSILVPLIYSLVNKSYSPSNNNNNNNNNASYEIFSTSILIVLFLLLTAFVFIIQGGNTKNTKNQFRKRTEPDVVVSDFSNLEMTDSRPRRTRREVQEEERRRRAEAAPPPIYDTLY